MDAFKDRLSQRARDTSRPALAHQSLGRPLTEAEQALIGKARVAVSKPVGSGNVRAIRVDEVVSLGIRAQDTNTQADIGLEGAVTVEIIDTIEHQFHGLQVAGSTRNRADRGAVIGSGRNAQLGVAIGLMRR